MKEILIWLRNNLRTSGRHRFMCKVLEDMGEDCSILEESGLKNLWEERGHTADYVWDLSDYATIKFINRDHVDKYTQKLYEEKIDCLNIIISKL